MKKLLILVLICTSLSVFAQEKKPRPVRKIIFGTLVAGTGAIISTSGFKSKNKAVGWIGISISMTGLIKIVDGIVDFKKKKQLKASQK